MSCVGFGDCHKKLSAASNDTADFLLRDGGDYVRVCEDYRCKQHVSRDYRQRAE